MKNLSNALVFGAILIASASAAYASPLSPGSVVVDGGAGDITSDGSSNFSVNSSTTTITFSNNFEATFGPGQGSLKNIPSGTTVTQNTPITFTVGSAINPAELFFSLPANVPTAGATWAFYATGVTYIGSNTLEFTGYVSDGIQADQTNADLFFTPNADGQGDFSS